MSDQALARTLRNTTIVFAVTVSVLLLVIAYALTRSTTTPVYAPLGDFPTQTITSDQPIPVGQDVGVTSTQCVTADHTVKLTGDTRWVAVEPAGASFQGNHGQGEREPGCHRFHFENVMPADVIGRVRQLAARGVHVSTWVITGTATPIAPNGERPVVKAYRTDNFRILG